MSPINVMLMLSRDATLFFITRVNLVPKLSDVRMSSKFVLLLECLGLFSFEFKDRETLLMHFNIFWLD